VKGVGEGEARREDMRCEWNSSLFGLMNCNGTITESRFCNSSRGGLSVGGGTVIIRESVFENNNPHLEWSRSLRRNIVCGENGWLFVDVAGEGDGGVQETSFWLAAGDCSVSGTIGSYSSCFFIPTLEAAEMIKGEREYEVVCWGTLLVNCNGVGLRVLFTGWSGRREEREYEFELFEDERLARGRVPVEDLPEGIEGGLVEIAVVYGEGASKWATASVVLPGRGDGRDARRDSLSPLTWIVAVVVSVVLVCVIGIVIGICVLFRKRWRMSLADQCVEMEGLLQNAEAGVAGRERLAGTTNEPVERTWANPATLVRDCLLIAWLLPVPLRSFFCFCRCFFLSDFCCFCVDVKIRRVGVGAFGQAFLCSHRTRAGLFVVKQIAKIGEVSSPSGGGVNWKNEYAAMLAVKSRFVVRLVEFFDDADDGYIVMEYCAGGNLRQLLKRNEEKEEEVSEEVCLF
jgi:hypothetical protein